MSLYQRWWSLDRINEIMDASYVILICCWCPDAKTTRIEAVRNYLENPAFFFSQSATQRVLMDKSGGSKSSQGASPRRFLRHHLPFAEA